MKKLSLLVALGFFTLGTATMVKADEDIPQATDGFEATETVEDIQIENTETAETKDLSDGTIITEEVENPEVESNSTDVDNVSE